MAQLVKNPPTMWETLEKGNSANILPWRIPWTIVHGVAKSQTRLSNFHFTILKRIICGKATKKIGMTIVFEGHIFNTYELCSVDTWSLKFISLLSLTKC